MTIEAHLDSVELLEARERHGALRRLTRVAIVSGIEDITDWSLLTQALDDAGVPQYGDYLTEDLVNASDLMLVERNPTYLDNDKVRVELVYENFMDLPQNLTDPRGGSVTGEVRCNIQQKTSNLDENGDQITVSHTYANDDPNHAGETIEQGGEIHYFEPQRTVYIEGIKQTATPWLTANSIVGRVNEYAWSGEDARTWLCTASTWKIAWLGPGVSGEHRYFMNFEFQHNPDTWDPTVVFIDDVTGKPPADLVEGTGYKTINKMPSADFEEMIGAPIQGG